jgi:hypothetical protein
VQHEQGPQCLLAHAAAAQHCQAAAAAAALPAAADVPPALPASAPAEEGQQTACTGPRAENAAGGAAPAALSAGPEPGRGAAPALRTKLGADSEVELFADLMALLQVGRHAGRLIDRLHVPVRCLNSAPAVAKQSGTVFYCPDCRRLAAPCPLQRPTTFWSGSCCQVGRAARACLLGESGPACLRCGTIAIRIERPACMSAWPACRGRFHAPAAAPAAQAFPPDQASAGTAGTADQNMPKEGLLLPAANPKHHSAALPCCCAGSWWSGATGSSCDSTWPGIASARRQRQCRSSIHKPMQLHCYHAGTLQWPPFIGQSCSEKGTAPLQRRLKQRGGEEIWAREKCS